MNWPGKNNIKVNSYFQQRLLSAEQSTDLWGPIGVSVEEVCMCTQKKAVCQWNNAL